MGCLAGWLAPYPADADAAGPFLARCAGYFNFRLKVCNKLKGLHKVYAMLHAVSKQHGVASHRRA